MFEADQLTKERERLSKLESLTVLDYIRTSIEILMDLKTDEDKDGKEDGKSHRINNFKSNVDNDCANSDFTSTFQSFDFAPKEYETQL